MNYKLCENGTTRDATPSLPPEARSVPPATSYRITSEVQEPGYSTILERLENVEREQIALKQGQSALLKENTDIIGLLMTLMVLMEELRGANAEAKPQPQLKFLGNDFILPNDYRPNDLDDILYTLENMQITSIGGT
uniref:Uncharacterized protein n=1 Tax=Cannabis sativa TaxID=3483 RepID=A0A803Q6K1_CANSA